MKSILTLAAALMLSAPSTAQAPAAPMSLEQVMLLRCSAAFAIGAAGQGPANPALGQRGREYFVRASARLMDELKLTREEMTARLRGEVAAQHQAAAASGDPQAYADRVMAPCLIALDASGL